jgi:hypothetical protein
MLDRPCQFAAEAGEDGTVLCTFELAPEATHIKLLRGAWKCSFYGAHVEIILDPLEAGTVITTDSHVIRLEQVSDRQALVSLVALDATREVFPLMHALFPVIHGIDTAGEEAIASVHVLYSVPSELALGADRAVRWKLRFERPGFGRLRRMRFHLPQQLVEYSLPILLTQIALP